MRLRGKVTDGSTFSSEWWSDTWQLRCHLCFFKNILTTTQGDLVPLSSHFPSASPSPWQTPISFLSLWIFPV